MSVYDRWHKSHPGPADEPCTEHSRGKTKLYPTVEHMQGDRWQVRWRDDTGRQCKQNFAKRSDAEAKDAQVRASLSVGTYIDAAAGKVKFSAYSDQWRAAQVHRDATATLTERAFRLYINPVIGEMALNAIRPAHVMKQLSDELAPGTVHVVYGYVASLFKTATMRDRLVAVTPCIDIKLPALPKRKIFVPEPAQVLEVASNLPEWYQVVPTIAAQSGLRPSEILGIEIGDINGQPRCIDFLRREIHVRQQLITTNRDGNLAYLGPPKTPLSERTVPVTQSTIDLVAAHLAAYPAVEVEIEDRTDLRHPKSRTARLLFVTQHGQPVKRSSWSGVWNPAAKKAGFPPRTGLHACRHLYASALIRYGESVKTVQHLLGHSSPAITLNVYAHLWPDSDDRARQAIDAAFADVPLVCPPGREAR
jgi:integrase